MFAALSSKLARKIMESKKKTPPIGIRSVFLIRDYHETLIFNKNIIY
jgi:hypothetical protein